MKKTNNITTTTLLRMVLLLLLMMAGAEGVWGQVVTSKSYYYQQNYESESSTATWKSSNNGTGLTLVENDATYGKYIQFYGNGLSGARTAYTNFFATDFYGGDLYVMEFDASVRASNESSGHHTELVVASDGYSLVGNDYFVNRNTTNKNYLFLLRSAEGNETTIYYLNGGNTSFSISANTWFHVKLLVDVPNKRVDYEITGAVITSGTYTITDNSSLKAKALVATVGKGYYGTVCVDNIEIYKLGWDVSLYNTALTNGNNENQIASDYPSLYNPTGANVTYSYDGTVLSNFSLAQTYPPRMKTVGDGTVTATIGSYSSSYTYRVTSTTGGGTYNPSTKTYTFDQPGIVSPFFQVTDVPGISMTLGEYDGSGNPTAVVVNSDIGYVLKAIDSNGYSHPNLDYGRASNTIPASGINGGTYYVFRTSAAGELTINGNLSNAKLYQYNGSGTPILKQEVASGTSMNANLTTATTYYLYNGKSGGNDNNTPLLNSFTYIPEASSLKFRNAQSIITVDVSEGSYTNPALSAGGLPISYSILSGPGSVNADGTVTFTGNFFLNPSPITVIATAGNESISYTINLVKNTWIFDDASKWKTQISDLGSNWSGPEGWEGYYRDGSQYYRDADNVHYNWENLRIADGYLPETNGLLFYDNKKNNRIIITPKDLETNKSYLGLTATFIGIDDIKIGQTVTVNWYANRGDAIMNIQDAAGEETSGRGRSGVTSLTATADGRVTLTTNGSTTYIRSIKVLNPTRAIGTLTYAKTVLNGTNTENRTGYTITDETGTIDLHSAYSGPGNFQSSNTSVATVDASGNITAVGTGTAIITATAAAKNSTTHQASVTLVALIEVVSDQATRIRTIDVDDLLYTTGSTTAADHNRTIPGFTLSFEGNGKVTSNTSSSLTLSNGGKMTITPRPHEGETITITQALVTVKSVSDTPQWKVNNGEATSVTAGGISLNSLKGNTLTLEATSGNIEITNIKLYYRCSNAENADFCLDDTKLSPTISFATSHYMRVPADGREFSQTPTLTTGEWFNAFDINYTYSSSATGIATIGADGTNGQLLSSGNSTITATFNETAYFASATATYTVSNTLLPGESYKDISMDSGQFIHIQASANAENTDLTLTNTNDTTLTFGRNKERRNTYALSDTTTTLTNNTNHNITIYWIHVVTKSPRVWLYYAGQEENYMEQVQFQGFPTGPIAGFRVMDVGDPYNPIDLTDAYSLTSDDYTITSNEAVLTLTNATTGDATVSSDDATVSSAGTATISHRLKKTGQADGYDETTTATAKVTVLPFSSTYVWNFVGTITNADKQLGQGWTYDDRGFQYGYFSNYMPILKYGNAAVNDDKHGIMLKDEFRWYSDRGLRVNLSQVKSSFKFPVKKGMEIDIYAATSSADVSHSISNVTDINGNATNSLYIQTAGEANPIHNYYLAAEDGVVEVKSTDKVGMYLKSITLKVPEIHFTDDIVTVLTTGDNGDNTVTNAALNVPVEHATNLTYAITSASLFDNDGNEEVLAAENYGQLATIGSNGIITLTGMEGWFEVTVTNTTAPNDREALEPTGGTYKVYVVDFRFDPSYATLNINNVNGEATYNERPKGYNKVITPVTYSYELSNASRARLNQSTNANPALTTYRLTAYSTGTITLKATTGRITTTCTLAVEDDGMMFGLIAPVKSAAEVEADNTFTNTLPTNFTKPISFTIDKAGTANCNPPATIDAENEATTVTLTDLTGYGAIRVTATDANSHTATFVLTLAYPASSKKKWDFYRSTTGLAAQRDHDNKIADYVGTHLNAQSVDDYLITGTNGWTTNTKWNKIYRNGDKEGRWAYGKSVKCDNAFIIEETAGLQIEAANNSFYVDNNSNAAYTHIGIHSRSTVIIPKLKNGDLVSLNMSRVIPNNGAILEAENVTDLAGNPVTEPFTITRSQTDYKENGVLATDETGARIIPGYYTFIAYKSGASADEEFDVSFTLADQGYLDILSIEIYTPDSYTGSDPSNGYNYTMLPVKLSSTGYPYAPTTLLKENEQQEVYALSFCHPMWSTSVGPASYELRGKTSNLDATLENTNWYSAGGAYYEDGRITVNQGYGKITVRMNNYTADRKYLIGYTPDYTLTVGHLPHQEYPYTWNFTNISGGTMKGRGINAFYSVWDDGDTWTDRGDNTYELNTDTEGGSFYIPGSTLVSTPRDLGMNGSRTYLSDNGYGLDEFNGLGFSGQFMFKTANQHASAPQRNTTLQSTSRRAAPTSGTVSLLEYRMDNPNYTYGEELAAGNGTIKFGANKREASDQADCGYIYRLDDGNTKYIKLKPMRAFREGDIIKIKAKDGNLKICLTEKDKEATAVKTFNCSSSEAEYTYTITNSDGIVGANYVCIYRNGTTSLVSEVSITGSYSSPTTQSLYTVAPTVVTIPDLNAGGKQEFIYIHADHEPTAITNATKVTGDDNDAGTDVYKYQVTAAGNSDVTFSGDTEIYQIGVTHLFKPITKVGTEGWATESRDVDIDYTLTGYFTTNNPQAYTVENATYIPKANGSGNGTVRVSMGNSQERKVVPHGSDSPKGLVLRQTSPKVAANYTVPLFVPAVTTALDAASTFDANLMAPAVDGKTFAGETENDNTVFILAKCYMTWKKEGENAVTHDENFTTTRDVAAFYRLHHYDETIGTETAKELNTLGSNKAYLLIPTDMVPEALWKEEIVNPAPHRYIAIEGVSDMGELEALEEAERQPRYDDRIYNLNGQAVGSDEQTLPAGIYIKNGKKILVK